MGRRLKYYDNKRWYQGLIVIFKEVSEFEAKEPLHIIYNYVIIYIIYLLSLSHP